MDDFGNELVDINYNIFFDYEYFVDYSYISRSPYGGFSVESAMYFGYIVNV